MTFDAFTSSGNACLFTSVASAKVCLSVLGGSLSFPDEVLDLGKSVRTLDVTHNKLDYSYNVTSTHHLCPVTIAVDIPEEISKLINMQRLILANNIIGRLPVNIGKLQSLKFIMLDGNQLTTLPDEGHCFSGPIGETGAVIHFWQPVNQPAGNHWKLAQFCVLLLLNVSHNKLKSLPESVGNCFSLEELQANENSIDELPTSVCSLIHLKSLCLDHNNLKQIPPSLLKECKTLQNISLHGNPISMDQFQQIEGFKEFEDRRKKKFDKQIDSNVMISSKGLDEGVDL
ncbi:plant intracellular Ras-group-related LRR protein 7 [Tanacetum coccineum]